MDMIRRIISDWWLQTNDNCNRPWYELYYPLGTKWKPKQKKKRYCARRKKEYTKRVDISVGLLCAAAGSSAQPHGSSSRRVTHWVTILFFFTFFLYVIKIYVKNGGRVTLSIFLYPPVDWLRQNCQRKKPKINPTPFSDGKLSKRRIPFAS